VLKLSRVHFPVTALGPGRRLGIWLQGCPLACAGCMSRDTWPSDGGVDIAPEELLDLWRHSAETGATGMTISGGEPLEQAGPLAAFLTAAADLRRATGGEQDFLLYTGYEPGELDAGQRAVLDLVDVVITGRYVARRPTGLIWRGSANQELVPRTELGVSRYRRYLDLVLDRAPVQVHVDGDRLWLVGVPPPGALPKLERVLATRGVRLEGVAWRP
jgi:anaerobic ribonucleoside-triphosphate reductase activating protein